MPEPIPGVQDNPWDTNWKQKLGHIDDLMKEHKVGEALQYIFASLFMLVGNFIEDYRMNRQAKIMGVLKQVQELRNKVLDDFNQYKDPSTPSSVADDAVAQFERIQNLMNEYGPDGKKYFDNAFITGFEAHFLSPDTPNASIFQTKALDGSGTNTAWQDAWANAGAIPNKDGILGIVNNQFNEAKTTTQSSIVQSKLNYWSKQDSTAKAVVHMGFSAMTGVEKTANNNLGK